MSTLHHSNLHYIKYVLCCYIFCVISLSQLPMQNYCLQKNLQDPKSFVNTLPTILTNSTKIEFFFFHLIAPLTLEDPNRNYFGLYN